MGHGQSPTREELKFLYRLFLKGHSDTDVVRTYQELKDNGQLGSVPFRTDVRFVRQRRKEFEAAAEILQSTLKRNEDPVLQSARQNHLADLNSLIKEWQHRIEIPVIEKAVLETGATMPYKEVSRVETTEVIRRWQAGASIRGLARATGLSRNTIRKYVVNAEACGLRREGPAPAEPQLLSLIQANGAGPRQIVVPTESILQPWGERIQEWVQDEQLQLTRVQELLSGQGCNIAYNSLRRFVARRGWSRKSAHTTVRMADSKPGELAEMDFGRLGLILDLETRKQEPMRLQDGVSHGSFSPASARVNSARIHWSR